MAVPFAMREQPAAAGDDVGRGEVALAILRGAGGKNLRAFDAAMGTVPRDPEFFRSTMGLAMTYRYQGKPHAVVPVGAADRIRDSSRSVFPQSCRQ